MIGETGSYDPWMIAYECSRGRCDIREIALKLRGKLLAPTDSRDYFEGLELFKALKSQLPPQMFIELLKNLLTRDLVEKLTREITCDRVLKYFKESRDKGYSALTILEIYPLLKMKDSSKRIIAGILSKIDNMGFDEDEKLEIYRALIHGPIASLPLSDMKDIIKLFIDKLGDKTALQASADLLVMIAQNYPSKLFHENPDIAEHMGLLLKAIAEKTLLLVDDDPDTALRIYHQIGLFKTLISGICRELGDMKLCSRVWRSAGETLEEMFRSLGGLEIMISNTSTSDYTSG